MFGHEEDRCVDVSLCLCLHIVCTTHENARAHARTHTHTYTHARMHTLGDEDVSLRNVGQPHDTHFGLP